MDASYFVGVDVQQATNHLCEKYKNSRYHIRDEWPPYHSQHHSALALIN